MTRNEVCKKIDSESMYFDFLSIYHHRGYRNIRLSPPACAQTVCEPGLTS